MVRPATTILFNDEHLPPAVGRQAAVGKSVLLVRQLSLLSITWPQPPEMEDSQTSQIETLLNEHEKDITNDP